MSLSLLSANAVIATATLAPGVNFDAPAAAPPGFEASATVIGWIKWGCLAVSFIFLMIAGARIAAQHRSGDGADAIMKPTMPLIGGLIIGAAGAIMAVLG